MSKLATYVRRIYEEIIDRHIAARYPWAAKLLRRLRVVYRHNDTHHVAYVTKDYRIYLCRRWLLLAESAVKRPSFEPAFILLHELMHIVLEHPYLYMLFAARERGSSDSLIGLCFNLAADAVVNDHLANLTGIRVHSAVYRDDLCTITGNPFPLTESDTLTLAGFLTERIEAYEIPLIDIWFPGADIRSSSGEDRGGIVISEGDPDLYSDPSRIPDRLRRELESHIGHKLDKAGVTPGSGKRKLYGEPRWLLELRYSILYSSKYVVHVDWKRTAKRCPLLPGSKKKYLGAIWCLFDVSGSIDDETLSLFAGEIVGLVRRGMYSRLYVVPWDAKPAGIYRIRSEDQLKKLYVRGGGGTVIGPTLRLVAPKIRRGDLVIILTDGIIFDMRRREVSRLLEDIGRRAHKIICLTTSRGLKHPLVKNIYLRGRTRTRHAW